jgi:hypothetical protein
MQSFYGTCQQAAVRTCRLGSISSSEASPNRRCLSSTARVRAMASLSAPSCSSSTGRSRPCRAPVADMSLSMRVKYSGHADR